MAKSRSRQEIVEEMGRTEEKSVELRVEGERLIRELYDKDRELATLSWTSFIQAVGKDQGIYMICTTLEGNMDSLGWMLTSIGQFQVPDKKVDVILISRNPRKLPERYSVDRLLQDFGFLESYAKVSSK